MASLLEAEDLTKIFSIGRGFKKRHIKAVDSISLVVPQDKPATVNIVGESGSGKSTIARMLLGLIKPSSGEVRYKGENVFKLSKEKWRNYRKDVQIVFQDPYGVYNPYYRIDRVFGVTIKKCRLASSGNEAQKLTDEALESVGLRPSDVLGRYPHQLSGGERQRVMLARIRMMRPKVIVADEPVSMIDVSLRAAFLNILINFKEEYGISNIFITHNLTLSDYLGGHMIVLYKGKALEEGPVEPIIQAPMHPYTKLLLKCVPAPDPERRWKNQLVLKEDSIASSAKALKTEQGCVYYHRCPVRLEACGKKPPETIESGNRKVACHLYE